METTNDRTVTVFGGTGFLGRCVVRHLRAHEFAVRIASRHPDRGHRLFGLDDPQLQSVGANIHDERSVADALAGAFGAVNRSVFTPSTDGRLLIRCTSNLPNEWRLKRIEPGSSALPTFRESEPIPSRNRYISKNAARANWRFGRR